MKDPAKNLLPVPSPETFGLPAGYQTRPPRFFDDTVNREEHQREEYELAASIFEQRGFHSVLDYGCGSGYKLEAFFPTAALRTGVDLPPTVAWLKANRAGTWLTPEEVVNPKVDLLLVIDVIEHFRDPRELMAKLLTIDFQVGLISTVDRRAVHGEGNLGPPPNVHHTMEWECDEFRRFVSRYFEVDWHQKTERGGQVMEFRKRGIAAEVTILIKTFCRPKSLIRLLESIREFYPKVPVVIADDGQPYAALPEDPCMTHLKLPFDVGLKMGRNLALALCRTPYFLLCDDDFVFTQEAVLETMVGLMAGTSLVVLGGNVQQEDDGTVLNHRLNISTEGGHLRTYQVPEGGDVTKCDMVTNFFLAKTDEFRRHGGWDSRLKIGGHEELFLRLKEQGAEVGFTGTAGILHAQECHYGNDQERYNEFRNARVWDYWPPIALKEYGITRCAEWEGHKWWRGYERYH